MLLVVGDVAGELVRPELLVALGGCRGLAALVPMPEASMDEDDCSVLREDDVGLSRQRRDVYSEPVARPMEE